MLNIHSFLQGIKKNKEKANKRKRKSSAALAAYGMVGIILVFSSDNFLADGINVVEAYEKAEVTTTVFMEANEETANEAQIRAEQKKDTDIQIFEKTVEKRLPVLGSAAIAANEKAVEVKEEKSAEEEKKKLEVEKKAAEKKAAEKKAAEKKAAEKKAAEKKAAEKKKKSENTINLSNEQKEVLLRIVEAEATGEDIEGRMLVANVVLNRVKSDKFPNTVKKVVFQKSKGKAQFSPIKDGRYWDVKVSEKTKEAIERVLSGEDNSQGALYFAARSKANSKNMRWFDNNLTWLFKHGGHEFFK